MPIMNDEFDPRLPPQRPVPAPPLGPQTPAPPAPTGPDIITQMSRPTQPTEDLGATPPPPVPPPRPMHSYMPLSDVPLGGLENQGELGGYRSAGFFESLPGRGISTSTPEGSLSPLGSAFGSGTGDPLLRRPEDELVNRIMAGFRG